MATWFSGTDTTTLQKEGNDTNCFVSLIVNNAGTYSAAITRKVQSKSEVTIKKLGQSYEFFGEGEKEVERGTTESTQIVDTEVIEYFMLDVERHETNNPLEYLDKRFKEIEDKKKAVAPKSKWSYDNTSYGDSWDMYDSYNSYDTVYALGDDKPKSKFDLGKYYEPTLWDKDTMKDMEVKSHYVPNPDLIYQAACRMVTCNLHLDTDKFNLRQWIKNYMDKVYADVFVERLHSNQFSSFDYWCDYIAEFTINTFNDPNIPADILSEDVNSAVAEALIDLLSEFRHNSYIKSYCEVLEGYL